MSSPGGSFSHASFYVGTDWLVRCSTYDDTTPILSVDAGPSVVTITNKGKVAGPAAVEFARALAREAQRFADEVERMHTAQLADADGVDEAARDSAA
jgi:hypothetical protein